MAVAVAGSGEQRGSLVGGSGAAVAGVGEVAAVVAVSSRLAACLGLALTPVWTHRMRGREGDGVPGRLINHVFYFSNGGPCGGRYPLCAGHWDRAFSTHLCVNAGKQQFGQISAELGGFP